MPNQKTDEMERWGIFLCDCNRSLAIDPRAIQKALGLPKKPVLYSRLRLDDVHALKYEAQKAKYQRLLVGCCGTRDFFVKELTSIGFREEQVRHLDLKEHCYWVEEDPAAANGKAARLLRAALEAEPDPQDRIELPVNTADNILIVADTPTAFPLAERLRDHTRVTLVLDETSEAFDSFLPSPFPCDMNRGRVTDVQGELGAFQVIVERSQPIDLERCVSCLRCIPICHTQAITAGLRLVESKCDQCGDCLTECGEVQAIRIPRRDKVVLQADQIVFLTRKDRLPHRPRRPGLHWVDGAQSGDVGDIAFRALALVGQFMKPEFLRYNIGTCAAGARELKGCGICITACPYDAIERDGQQIQVNAVSCEGCGACTSACPTSALKFMDPAPELIYAQMRSLLRPLGGNGHGPMASPPVLLFHCPQKGRHALKNARSVGMGYPGSVLPVEVPCLRHVSEAFMLAAFRMGAGGVALLGCEHCPHGEREPLLQKLDFTKLALDSFGLGGERLRLFTADFGSEAEALRGLAAFAGSLTPTPIQWDGTGMAGTDNRAVIAEVLQAFLDQTGREPGLVQQHSAFPFALAEVNAEGCTLCRSCVNVCPTHAFRLDEETHRLDFKYINCVACGLCEKACPESVITLNRDVYFDRSAMSFQTVVQDEMVGCIQCGKEYVNKKALTAIQSKVGMMEAFMEGRADLLLMCPDCRAVKAMFEMQKGWEP
ncbi:MAG: 4Fe-4S dicluster domain-containing protein [Candidatus Methylomirabilales bacterium]